MGHPVRGRRETTPTLATEARVGQSGSEGTGDAQKSCAHKKDRDHAVLSLRFRPELIDSKVDACRHAAIWILDG